MGFLRAQFIAASVLTMGGLLLLGAEPAQARLNGIGSQGCSGCHGLGETRLAVSVTSREADASLLRIRIDITGTAGGGFYLWLREGKGSFVNLVGEGTKLAEDGVMHSTPKRASGGVTTFNVDFRPAQDTLGVLFGVAAVGANMDGRRQGDLSGFGFATVAVGCSGGTRYFRDYDGDGHGRSDEDLQMLACARPEGFSPVGDDCDDNDERVAPSKIELCNRYDDNCNGMIDEGLPIFTLYPDDDGDGYGRSSEETQMGCGPSRGWGVGNQDCDDRNPEVHPGAEEICNLFDDDCDGRIDEDARTTCGLGWCRRYATGCGENVLCMPGRPRKEVCNYFDDDCDGEIDEETDVCPERQRCDEGRCVFVADPTARNEEPSLPEDEEDEQGSSAGPSHRQVEIGCAVSGRQRSADAGALLVIGLCALWARRRCRS